MGFCTASFSALLLSALLVVLPTQGQAAAFYRVPTSGREALMKLRIEVDHDRVDGGFAVELTEDQVRALRQAGIDPERLAASEDEADRQFRQMPGFETFHTYDQIRDGCYACALAHPEIARIQVLGSSLEGREIFAVKISDSVQADEDEPELAYWGGIHGNEYAGGEMPYLYALYLCDNYGIDPEVTQW